MFGCPCFVTRGHVGVPLVLGTNASTYLDEHIGTAAVGDFGESNSPERTACGVLEQLLPLGPNAVALPGVRRRR